MKITIRIFKGLLLAAFLIMPLTECLAVNDLSPKSSAGVEVDQSAQKNQEETFFNMKVDKLSGKFFARLIIDLISVLILIRLIYYPNYRRIELFFTFLSFNFIIFLMSFLLNKVDMGMGAAFGLFAVFSMLRYRTENLTAKDMTYLFLTITIGLITAISKVSAIELSILNGLILLITFLVEGNLFMKKEYSKSVQYENIEMINPENHPALILDLKKRTGLNIHRVTIEKFDFLKDSAMVKFYYYEDKVSKQVYPSALINEEVNIQAEQ
ncbi:MAG: DUF4956 domain-containing protein [Bacteroidia bacterium]